MGNSECRGLIGFLSLPTLYVAMIGIGLVLFTRPMNPADVRLYVVSGYVYAQLWVLAMAWPLMSLVCQTADGSSVCSARAYRAWLGSIGFFVVSHYLVEAQMAGPAWHPWQMQAVALAAVVCEFMWPGPYAPSEAEPAGKEVSA